jgi:hypothetical protein
LSCDYFLEDSLNEKVESVYNDGKSFSLIHTNIRSIPKNIASFDQYLSLLSIRFNVIAITETWLNENTASLYNIEHYSTISNHRKTKRGGGVALYIHDTLNYKLRPDLTKSDSFIESLFIELNDKKVIGVIYRPPNTDVDIFNKEIKNLLKSLKSERKKCYICGDFNINLLNVDNHAPSSDFIDLMYSFGFFPLINKPTRVTSNSATIIDNIFSNELTSDKQTLNGILVTSISDHFPIFHLQSDNRAKTNDNFIFTRKISDTNKKCFIDSLSNCSWEDVMNNSDPNEAFSLFHDTIMTIYNKCFPIRKIKIGYKTKLVWLSEDLKKMIKVKNKLFFKFKKYPSIENENLYKHYRNRLNKLLKNAEREYYNNLLIENKINTKKKWSIIKEVINKKSTSKHPQTFNINGSLTDDKSKIANAFNKYFNNIGNNLAKKIPNVATDPLSFVRNNIPDTIVLREVTSNEVEKIIKKLKNSSPGWDGLLPSIIKQISTHISVPISYVINLSLINGVFPTYLKITKVIPLYKANDNMIMNNYRPIAVLSVFSKIFESVMYRRLIKFINAKKILYELQFGFIEKSSTSMAINLLVDKISKAMDEGKYSIGIFLDFSKAFDTVNHNILFSKLQHYGIRGLALSWLKSYLVNRQQYVCFEGVESTKLTTNCGVPQGSILGPLLFLLYINDIAYLSNSSYMILYADDTNVFFNGNDIDVLYNEINRTLDTIKDWLQANKLSLNVDKSQCMFFTHKSIQYNNEIKIANEALTQVETTKFLGIYLDSKLSFKKHLTYIKGKVARGIGIICKARKLLNRDTLSNLYYSFVYPHIVYCIEVWGNAADEHVNPLYLLQKKCVRIISNSSKFASSKPLFMSLEFLTISQIYAFRMFLFCYKFINESLPCVFNDMFVKNSSIHSHDTRNQNKFRIPCVRTELRKKSISYSAIQFLNYENELVNYTLKEKKFKENIRNLVKTLS